MTPIGLLVGTSTMAIVPTVYIIQGVILNIKDPNSVTLFFRVSNCFYGKGIYILEKILNKKLGMIMFDFFLIIFLFCFTGRRFINRSNDLPPTFIFVSIGLILGAIGSLLLITLELGFIDPNFILIAKATFYTGFMQSLIIGIGSRLIPAFLGHPPVTHPLRPAHGNKIWNFLSTDLKITAIMFTLSFLFYLKWSYVFLGHFIRLVILFYIAVKYWKIYMPPKNKGFMYFLLWLSSWSILIGLFFLTFFPPWQLQSLHLIYISGFGLLTLMISTRVTLAHGGIPLFPVQFFSAEYLS